MESQIVKREYTRRLVTVLGIALVALSAGCVAAAVRTEREAWSAGEEFAEAIRWVRDQDGDGIRELAVGAPSVASSAGSEAGVVDLHGGRTGAFWCRLEGEREGEDFGRYLGAGGKTGRLVIGSQGWREPPGVEGPSGRVTSSGPSMSGFEWYFSAPEDIDGLGVAICDAGDLDADGSRDIVVAASRRILHTPIGSLDLAVGSVFALRGVDGKPIWTAHEEGGLREGWPRGLADAGDLDRDGVPDIVRVVKAVPDPWVFGRGPENEAIRPVLRIYSGATGRVLGARVPGPDVAVRIEALLDSRYAPDGSAARHLVVLSGPDPLRSRASIGTLSLERTEGAPGGAGVAWNEEWGANIPRGVAQLAGAIGRRADGGEFLVIGDWSAGDGKLWIADRAVGGVARECERPEEATGYGYRVLSGEDLDGDGDEDIVVAASGYRYLEFEPEGTPAVFAHSGRTLRRLWTIGGAKSTPGPDR